MTLRSAYQIRKSKFLLWKETAPPAKKLLLCIVLLAIAGMAVALLVWRIRLGG